MIEERMMENADFLFVLKKDDVEDKKRMAAEAWGVDDGTITLFECEFSNREVKVCCDFASKLSYAVASMRDDNAIEEAVREIFPEVWKIEVRYGRYAKSGNLLKTWMEKYNFTLVDFLTNRKYVVVSNDWRALDDIYDLGLIDEDNIEFTTFDKKSTDFTESIDFTEEDAYNGLY